MDISADDRATIVRALDREATRLEALARDYKAIKPPSNVVAKAMADEGKANVEARTKELRTLIIKLQGKEAPHAVRTP